MVMVALVMIALVTGGYLFSQTEPAQRETIAKDDLVELPSPRKEGRISVEAAIAQRRSVRAYSEAPLSLQAVAQLLWSAQGITSDRGFRAAPSAGATYPLELYLVVGEGRVQNLAAGVYHYQPKEHRVETVREGDLRTGLREAALDQGWVGEAPVDLVVAAVYGRTTGKYGERGRRYVHMEAGHAAENLYLQAEAMGLGMVTVGAFDDQRVQEVLGLPPEQRPLYVIPVGPPAE